MSSPEHCIFSLLLLRSSLPSHCLSPSGFPSHLSSQTQKANAPVSWLYETNHPKTQWLKATVAIYFAHKSAFKARPTTSQSHTEAGGSTSGTLMAGKSISKRSPHGPSLCCLDFLTAWRWAPGASILRNRKQLLLVCKGLEIGTALLLPIYWSEISRARLKDRNIHPISQWEKYQDILV